MSKGEPYKFHFSIEHWEIEHWEIYIFSMSFLIFHHAVAIEDYRPLCQQLTCDQELNSYTLLNIFMVVSLRRNRFFISKPYSRPLPKFPPVPKRALQYTYTKLVSWRPTLILLQCSNICIICKMLFYMENVVY